MTEEDNRMTEEDKRMASTIRIAAVALILVAAAFVVVTVLVVGAGASNNVSLLRSTALVLTALSVGLTVVGMLGGGFFVIWATMKAREDIFRRRR
jgi:hypothetical protein